MGYLIFDLVTVVFLTGFLVLTRYEEKRGARVWADKRAELDDQVTRITYLATHFDFAAFFREETRRLASQISHVTVALSLRAVRALERLLTRLIVYLRSRHPVSSGTEETRPFVKALSDFKESLKNSVPPENGVE